MECILTGKVDRAPIPYEERSRYWAEMIYRTAAALVDAYARAEKRDINQEVIADRLERDKSQISRWLSGESNMTVKSLSEMALAMECDLQIEFVDFQALPMPNYSFSLATLPDTSSPTVGDARFTDDGLGWPTSSGARHPVVQAASA